MRTSRHSTVARVAQPATRVDTTCWQLFRPDINQYGPFLFFVVAEVMSNYLTTDGLKIFLSTSGGPLRPEARGICRICHMVNPALLEWQSGVVMSSHSSMRYMRVRGVDGSCAEQSTVESYTVFICQQSYLLLFGCLLYTSPSPRD